MRTSCFDIGGTWIPPAVPSHANAERHGWGVRSSARPGAEGTSSWKW